MKLQNFFTEAINYAEQDPKPEQSVVDKFADVDPKHRSYYIMKWAEEKGMDSDDAMFKAGYVQDGYIGAGAWNWRYVGMDESIEEVAGPKDCWDGYKKDGTQPGTGKNKGKRVNKCVKEDEESYDDDDAFFEAYGWIDGDSLEEAEYQGRKVKLNKPMQGDVKKFKVYVKDPKTGNVKKVNFGHGGSSVKGKAMKIRKSNPKARKSFRARHNCDNPGPKTKARYWSCRKW